MLNLTSITVRCGRFPRRGENAIDHLAQTGIMRITRMKLNETRRAFLIEQKTADVIRNCFLQADYSRDWLTLENRYLGEG